MNTLVRDDRTVLAPLEEQIDVAASLESGQAHRWSRGVGSVEDELWHWGVAEGNLIKIRHSSDPSLGPWGGLEFRSAPLDDPECLKSHLWRYFRLDDDIGEIFRGITGDPRVAAMVQRHRGVRLLRTEPWECLIAFICSANSNIPRIHSNMESMAEAFGRPLTLDGHTRYSFPTPENLAAAGEAALRSLGLGFRAPYVAQAATAVAEGRLDLEALRHMPHREAQARLMEQPGIGPKIADCVLLHSLDKLEAFPIDVWVRRALKEWYFADQKPPTDRVMNEWAQGYFGRYAGYAELYLFHGRRLGKKGAETRSE